MKVKLFILQPKFLLMAINGKESVCNLFFK